ncbi:MAG: glycosyltransferase family 4 protein [Acidobacteriota bacterium]
MNGASRSLDIAFIGARGVVGTYSGIETYYEEVGSRLVARGHRVVAYCRNYFTPDVAAHRGVTVRRLPCLRGSKHLETLSHSLLATFDCLPRRFDVVQFHAIGSAPLAWMPRLAGARTVVSVRGLDWQRAKWGGFARFVLQSGEWASARAPNATSVVSSTLAEHYARVHGRRPTMIPNAVPPAERAPLERLRAHGLSGDDFVLYAGRLSPEKNVDTLIAAFAALRPRETLVIAGGSSQTDEYVEQLRAAADAADGARVLFLGRVDRTGMRELLSHCRVYVLPSTMEGLSVGLLEAVAYGAAIVASEIPENREVVGDAAVLVPPGDVDALRGALHRLLGEGSAVRERLNTLRARAAARAASWPNWDEVARRTEALYLRLTEPDPKRLR